MKAAADELGFEIEVDESIQAEEKPARSKKEEPKVEVTEGTEEVIASDGAPVEVSAEEVKVEDAE